MKIKKILMSLTAAVTALTAGLQSTVFAYAAPFNTKYISDIKSIQCKSKDDAIKAFESEGYTILDTDVNPTLQNAVYIGYKTSSDINDAITGLKFMNMRGQYSFTQYETVLKNYRADVDAHIEGLVPAIMQFRSNYEAGMDCAVHAYDMMNNVYDAVSGSNMGDFLMNCNLKPNEREPLVNAMMKGNAGIVQAIERYLALGASEKAGSWFDDLEDIDLTSLTNAYMDEYPTISLAQRAMAQDYGDTAMLIKGTFWDDLYNALQNVENSMPQRDDGSYDISEVFSDIPEEFFESGEELTADDLDAINNRFVASAEMITVYEILSEYEYEDESLLDFFNRPADEVTLEELYPLVSVMTDAQRGTLESTGLVEFIMQADAPQDWDAEHEALFKEYSDATESSISLYYDVNLRAFEDGVALTSAATQQDVASVSFLEAITHNTGFETKEDDLARAKIFGIASGAGLVGTFVFYGIGHLIRRVAASEAVESVAANTAANTIKKFAEKSNGLRRVSLIHNPNEFIPMTGKKALNPFTLASAQWKQSNVGSAFGIENFGTFLAKTMVAFGFVCEIFAIVSAVYAIYSWVVSLWSAAVYTEIPALICDAWQGDTFNDYVFYDAVQGLNQDDAKYADMNGYDQDRYFLNGNQGWLVLYYTKDKRVGNPLTELKFQIGSSKTPLGYEGTTIFGNGAATNLTSKEFTGQSADPQIYLFFKRSATGLTGTVTSAGTYVLTGTIGLLAGGLIGGLIGSKRKKKPAGTPAAA